MYLCIPDTVRLVQLVEHQMVVLGVMGSSPISHPKEGSRMAALFHISTLERRW